MKYTIIINRHVIAANKRLEQEGCMGPLQAPIAVRNYKKTEYCMEVDISTARLIYDPDNADCSGATVWLETEAEPKIIR